MPNCSAPLREMKSSCIRSCAHQKFTSQHKTLSELCYCISLSIPSTQALHQEDGHFLSKSFATGQKLWFRTRSNDRTRGSVCIIFWKGVTDHFLQSERNYSGSWGLNCDPLLEVRWVPGEELLRCLCEICKAKRLGQDVVKWLMDFVKSKKWANSSVQMTSELRLSSPANSVFFSCVVVGWQTRQKLSIPCTCTCCWFVLWK